ncbi:hypothetical protein EV426DRAFT_606669 [Tirmania nivea]|nr:hypothetical protein EV426DRAFT_606669 [Tirmania nivea]
MPRTVLSRPLYTKDTLQSPFGIASTSPPLHDPVVSSLPRFCQRSKSRVSPTLLPCGSASQEVLHSQLADQSHPVKQTDSSYATDISCSTLTPPLRGVTTPTVAPTYTHVRPFSQLHHYLATSTLLTVLQNTSSLYIRLPATSPVIPPPLLSRTYKSLRLDFSPHTSILRIWMPTPLHDSIQCFAFEMLSTIPKRPDSLLLGTITSFRLPTALYVHHSTSDHNSAYQPPPTTTGKRKAAHSGISNTRRKRIAAVNMKTPDYAYLPKGALFPTVVFQVGWTEDPNDLYSDAEQWLIKTSGLVQLVITVHFMESNSPLAKCRSELTKFISESPPEMGSRKLRETLIVRLKDNPGSDEELLRAIEGCTEGTNLEPEWGEYRRGVAKGADFSTVWEEADEVVEDSNSDEALSPAPSTVSDHILERQQIDPNQWVGEITAKVNFFRYSKTTGQMYKDGEEYVLAPDGTVSPRDAPPPTLSMRDVWGEGVEKKKAEKDAAGGTACVWDWKAFYGYVESARRDYAFNRKKDLVTILCRD